MHEIKILHNLKIISSKVIILFIIVSLCSFFSPAIKSAQRNSTTSITGKVKTKRRVIRYRHRRRHPRRHYNPAKTRLQAIAMIRTSEKLSDLAGLEPMLNGAPTNIDDDTVEEIPDEVVDYTNINNIDNNTSDTLSEKYDINTFKTLWLSYVDDGKSDDYTDGGINKKDLISAIMDWLGTPYKFGGITRRAIDCSAFTRSIYSEVCGMNLPRTARFQIHLGEKISRSELEFGDLIFFHTYSYRFASHVGIYLGDGLFAHASSTYGVTVSSLNARYYTAHFIGGRRLYLNNTDHYVNNDDNRVSE